MKRAVLFLLLLFALAPAAQTPLYALEKVEKAAICTEIIQEGAYTRCVVVGGSAASLGGGNDGQLLNVTGIQRSDGTIISSQNVVLEFRDSTISLGDTAVRFYRFDSVIFNNSDMNLGNSLSFNGISRLVNFTAGSNIASTYLRVDAFTIDISANRVNAPIIILIAPFIAASPNTEIEAGTVWLGDSAPLFGIASRAPSGEINFLAKVDASDGVQLFAPTSDIRIGNFDSYTIALTGKKVKLGTPTSQVYPHDKEIGNPSTNFTVIASNEVTLHGGWNVRGNRISIYSTEDVNLYGDLRALTISSGVRSKGSIALVGEKNLYINRPSDVVAEQGGSVAGRFDSVLLSFPKGNVLIKGRIDNYWDSTTQSRMNDVSINAGQVYLQSTAEFKIDAGGRLKIRASGITLPSNAPDKIRGELALPAPTGERIAMRSCTLQYDGAASFRAYWQQDISFCPDEVTLNIYGYLTNPGSQPFASGSARVNSIQVAVPNGVFVLTEAGQNITSTANNVFNNGFFSFALPPTRLSPGAYRVNTTFSTSQEFSCETGACQDRVVIANVGGD